MQAYIKASNGQRFLAFIIDAILIAGAAFGLMFAILAMMQFDFARYNELIDKISEVYYNYMRTGNNDLLIEFENMAKEFLGLYMTRIGIYYAMVALIILLYLVVLPHFWQYQTLGRLFAKVKIIARENNLTPSFGKLILRELVGTFIFYYLINFILVLISGILCLSSNKMLSRTELVYYKPVEVNQHTLFGDQDEDYYNYKYGKPSINAEVKEVKEENNNNNDNLNQNQNDNVDNNLNNNNDNNQDNDNKIIDGDDEYQVI